MKVGNKKIKVLNVGQGDCIVFNDLYDNFCNKKITVYIDLGPGNIDVTNETDYEDIDIFLTHHHNDHIGGLRYFIGDKFNQIRNIYVPDYQEEVTLIAKAILNLKGMRKAKDCYEFINELNNIVNNHKLLVNISRNHTGMIRVCHQGNRFYNSMTCLNPPAYLNVHDWIEECDTKEIKLLLETIFEKEFAENIYDYFYMNSQISNRISQFIKDIKLNNDEEIIVDSSKVNFVADFIIKNSELLMAFHNKPTRKNLSKIYRKFVKCCHDTCLVLRYQDKKLSFLLTGDASKKVLNRLIYEDVNLYSTYLKLPHHGSKYNISKKILSRIQPEVSIISHGNACFGKSNDPHPHKKTLNMLEKLDIKILITNDVIKNGYVIMKKKNHYKDDYIDIQ